MCGVFLPVWGSGGGVWGVFLPVGGTVGGGGVCGVVVVVFWPVGW